MARNLTENQQKFLEVLFDDAGGDVVLAKKLAGYSNGTPTRIIVEALKDEIGEATRSISPVQRLKLQWQWYRLCLTLQSLV